MVERNVVLEKYRNMPKQSNMEALNETCTLMV